MHSLSHDFLDACSFHSEQLAVLTALGHARGRQDLFSKQTPETLEALRQVAAVESSESSNRIEGIEAPRKRIEALVLRRTEPRDRSEQEIAGYRDALALIHESHPHMPLSAGVLLQLHQTLYRYHPAEGGRWKAADNEIVERNPDGSIARVRFRTVSVVETPGAIESLVARANEAFSQQQREALLLIPLVALDLLCIHPFRDGNGRVARLVTLLLLYRAGFEVGRYISLERIIEQSKQSYYETLEESSRGWHEGSHDPHPWLEYFWGTLQRAYREFEERVGAIGTGRGSKSDHVRAAVLRRPIPFAISDLERDCPGVSRDLIRLVLGKMRKAGEVELLGRGRGARWRRLEA